MTPAPGRLWPYLVIIAVGLLLTAPVLALGAPRTHSVVYNLSWAEQFTALLRQGVLYPRWLPEGFAGFGSPAFFFYAPLPFYVTAPFLLAAPAEMDANRAVGLAQALMVVASGLTMRLWLRRHVTERRAVFGAIFYMAAPYHLFDVYVRGSFGEILAYALLPVLVAALADLLRGERGAWPRFALAVALLLLTHLPTSLLVGVFVVPAVLLHHALTATAPLRPLVAAVLSGTFGLVLAAAYVAPALLLIGETASDALSHSHFDARRWILADPAGWPNAALMGFVGVLAGALALIGIAALGLALRGHGRAGATLWAGLLLLILLVMSGAIPGVWSPSSPLSRVQFPWRLLLPAEFAATTALVLALPSSRKGAVAAIGMACVLLVPAQFFVAAAGTSTLRGLLEEDWFLTRSLLSDLRPEPLEYLPRGHSLRYTPEGSIDLAEFQVVIMRHAERGLAWADPPDSVRIEARRTGMLGMEISIDASMPARIHLRQFHFPTWRLTRPDGSAGPPLEPIGRDRLASFEVPAGRTELRLRWAPPAVVRAFGAVSLLAWGGLFLALALLRVNAVRRSRRRRASRVAEQRRS
jgi:hypothetical protein